MDVLRTPPVSKRQELANFLVGGGLEDDLRRLLNRGKGPHFFYKSPETANLARCEDSCDLGPLRVPNKYLC